MDLTNYDQYRAGWIKTHRESIPRRERGNLTPMWIKIIWFLIFLAAALISAVHTVPAIIATIPLSVDPSIRNGAGLSGFLAIENLIFAAPNSRDNSKWTLAALVLAITVAITANIYSGLEAITTPTVAGVAESVIGPEFKAFVAIVLGITIPLIAFVSGERVSKILAFDYTENQRTYHEHQVKMKDIEARINASYTRDQNKNVPKAVREPSNSTDSLGLREVAQYLRDNPTVFKDLINGTLKSKVLADQINTHASTVTKAKQLLLSNEEM